MKISKLVQVFFGGLYIATYVICAVLFFPSYVLVSSLENLILGYKFFFKFLKSDVSEYPNRLKKFLYGDHL